MNEVRIADVKGRDAVAALLYGRLRCVFSRIAGRPAVIMV
jgi:hypothetical protein